MKYMFIPFIDDHVRWTWGWFTISYYILTHLNTIYHLEMSCTDFCHHLLMEGLSLWVYGVPSFHAASECLRDTEPQDKLLDWICDLVTLVTFVLPLSLVFLINSHHTSYNVLVYIVYVCDLLTC